LFSEENLIPTFFIPIIGTAATIFTLWSTVPQIIKAIRTRKMDDVSIWLILSLLVGLSLWIVYGISKNDIIIIGGNLPGVILNLILLALKKKFSKEPLS
jgi:MtN3 and saliva related transmembrane protein